MLLQNSLKTAVNALQWAIMMFLIVVGLNGCKVLDKNLLKLEIHCDDSIDLDMVEGGDPITRDDCGEERNVLGGR